MCGIAGIIGPGAEQQRGLMSSMLAELAHRGPDDEGLWCQTDAVLGHRRLSILDLSPAGHQPMSASDRRYHITFNGEIYNYLEIRNALAARGHVFKSQSDTEVLLAAYLEWGEKCLERLNGMWAFAIWDTLQKRLFASRDRFGKKPFYYVLHQNRFYFASEMKALLLIPGLSRRLNAEAFLDFCAERIVSHSGETLIRDVIQMPPASTLVWQDGRIQVQPYWSFPSPEESFQETERSGLTERIADLLEDAVRLRLRADTPVGCLVSGGLDSSTLACLMRKNRPASQEIHLFTTITDPPNEEAQGVALLLNQSGFKLHTHTPTARLFWEDLPKLVWHQEEPFADGSMAAHFALMREARSAGVPVLLTGQGADEVFAGYPSYLWMWLGGFLRRGAWTSAYRHMRDAAGRQPLSYPSILFNALPLSLREPVRAHHIRRQLDWVHPDLVTSLKIRRRYDENAPDALNDYLKKSMSFWTLPGFLHYEDRNSMAFGVETRLPFLDYRLVEDLFRLPSGAKVAGAQLKRVLRDAAKGWVPPPIIERFKKQGYPAPLAAWLRELRPEVKEVAHGSSARDCPLLHYPSWIKAVDRFLDDQAGPLEPVWRGLISALWYERFLKPKAVPEAALV